jgi:hypothetical protein
MALLVLLFLLLLPTWAFGQTANTRMQDGVGNKTVSTTGTPATGDRGLTTKDAILANRFPTALADADALANDTATAVHGKCYLYNGTTWDRCRGAISTGLLVNVSNSFFLDATFTGRFPAAAALADATANPTLTGIATYNMCFNGTTWDRCEGGTKDTDDNSVAFSQVPHLALAEMLVSNGTSWVRWLTYLEDVASAGGEQLVLAGTIRQDTPASTTSLDGDFQNLKTDSIGRIWTHVGAVDGSVTIGSLPNEGQQTAANSISVTLDTDNDFVAADGAAPPTGRAAVGGLTSGATAGLMESLTVASEFANVNVSTATTTLLITGVSGRHVRISAISMVTAGANNVALISGTGATCGTGTTGMTGGTTAASGYNFAANGGLTQGTGSGEINRTNSTGDSVCVITSAATQLSGRISFAIY